MNHTLLLIATCAAMLAIGCDRATTSQTHTSSAQTSPPRSDPNDVQTTSGRLHFTDVSEDSGIPREFRITSGTQPSSEILEVKGSGMGLIDFDNDGDLDLFVANGATLDDPEKGPGCKLFENVGELKFRDVTEKAGINLTRWSTGVAVGDFNGDRLDDLYICCYGPNVLLKNNGDGTFSDVTPSAFGPSTASTIPQWSTSAAFGDLDNDGDLDLYVCNYLAFDLHNRPARTTFKDLEVMGGPHGLPAQPDVLYENLGDGTFRDVTQQSGIASARPSFGLNVIIADFDDDGRQDITVANDSMPDFLFINKTETANIDSNVRIAFEEVGIASGLAANADGGNQASMGLAIADVDGNGLPDKFTTVFSSDTNALHLNRSTPKAVFFEDRAQQYGLGLISRPFLSWSAGFFDFDHDGDEDLLFVNGHVYPQATKQRMDSDYEQPPLLFERDGARFSKASHETVGAWLGEAHRDRSAVFADLDHDGDIDIVIGEMNGPLRVIRNDCISSSAVDAAQSPWLIVELKDLREATRNHRGLGAKIEVHTSDHQIQRRWLSTGGGFLSSGAPYAHFGFANGQSAIAKVMVRWPDGHVQQFENVKPSQRLIVERR